MHMQLRENHFIEMLMERRIQKVIINFEIMMVLTAFLEMMVQKSKWEENPLFASIVEVRII